MKKLLADKRILFGSIIIAALYWALAFTIPPSILLEILDGLLLPLSVLVLIVFMPLAIQEFRKKSVDSTGRLLLGIVLGWSATLVLQALAVYGRTFGRLTEFIESPVFGFIVWCLIWAALLHITAPHAHIPLSKGPYGRWIVVALIVGFAVAGFFLGVQAGHWFNEMEIVKPMTG